MWEKGTWDVGTGSVPSKMIDDDDDDGTTKVRCLVVYVWYYYWVAPFTAQSQHTTHTEFRSVKEWWGV